MKHTEIFFQCLLKPGLKLKEIKCNFLKRHIKYVGHLISETGFEPLPEKLSSLQDMPPPRNLKEVMQFWVWPVIIENLYQVLLTFCNL